MTGRERSAYQIIILRFFILIMGESWMGKSFGTLEKAVEILCLFNSEHDRTGNGRKARHASEHDL